MLKYVNENHEVELTVVDAGNGNSSFKIYDKIRKPLNELDLYHKISFLLSYPLSFKSLLLKILLHHPVSVSYAFLIDRINLIKREKFLIK